jgi:hypothetical protein
VPSPFLLYVEHHWNTFSQQTTIKPLNFTPPAKPQKSAKPTREELPKMSKSERLFIGSVPCVFHKHFIFFYALILNGLIYKNIPLYKGRLLFVMDCCNLFLTFAG